MSDEERNKSYLPEIIDVEVEPDFDFEIREPKDGTKEKVTEENSVEEETINEDTITVEGVEEPKKDTSFTAFKNNQKANEKKWRRRIGGWIKTFILAGLIIFFLAPLLGFGGVFGILGIGLVALFCIVALGVGLLGLGIGAFLIGAESASFGAVIFFMSLVGVGGGGLGILLLLALLIGIKNLIVAMFARINRPKHQKEEA